ncbi:hypothetical protein [Haloarcula sp. CGMCC 1.6347]|uniref:hypothetical protein n=1 Tax=Haloarcula sp. CGMCC 1.6347 TaxID=3111455 RepID=UPI00300F4470
MTIKSVRIKASKNREQFEQLPVRGEFRKRDVEVLDNDQSLWAYFTNSSSGILVQVGFDDDANVGIYTWPSDMQDFLTEFQSGN